MKHGTGGYRKGCRCRECTEAVRVYEMSKRRAKGINPPETVPIGVRIDKKTLRTESCWLWMGSVDGRGYGMIRRGPSGIERAHRVMWELEVGPIPEGMTLDHWCENKNCVFPGHLELVTPSENSRRKNHAYRETVAPFSAAARRVREAA